MASEMTFSFRLHGVGHTDMKHSLIIPALGLLKEVRGQGKKEEDREGGARRSHTHTHTHTHLRSIGLSQLLRSAALHSRFIDHTLTLILLFHLSK